LSLLTLRRPTQVVTMWLPFTIRLDTEGAMELRIAG